QKWQINSAGNGAFKSENEARIGTDENKVFLKLQADKSESSQADYAAEILYSRNISDFWDVQTGLRYRQENISQHTASLQNERFDRSEEHTSELQSRENLVCRLLLEK